VRIESLTGFRIIAAAAVFLSHVSNTSVLPGRAFVFMQAGYNGVTLFFTLSGFVLAWNYADRLASPTRGNIWSYFVARLARIYPLYLFALALGAIPFVLGAGLEPKIWLHIFALQPWSPSYDDAFSYNGPGWSIGVEFFLYACFPLIIVLLARAGKRTLIAVLIGATAAVFALALIFMLNGNAALSPFDSASVHRWLYRSPLTRLGDFTVGIVAALMLMHLNRPPAWAAYTAQALGLISFVVLMSDYRMLNSVWSWDSAYLLPTFLVIWGLAAGPRSLLSRFLGSKLMVILGESSFAFYLLHAPLLDLIRFPVPTELWQWVLIVVTEFAVIMLAAIGAHKLVEMPAQRWLRGAFDRKRLSVPTPKST